MKYFTLLTIFLIFLLSCSTNSSKKNHDSKSVSKDSIESNPNEQVQNLTTDTLQEIDNSDEFLRLFQDLQPKGLHLYFSYADSNHLEVKENGKGIIIDVNKFSYINNSNLFPNIKLARTGYCNISAIGKFDLNDRYYGLIIRQCSQYWETLIELMLWDKNKKKVIKGLDLADSFGDAGWYFDKESWITDYQFSKQLTIVSRQKDFVPKYLPNSDKFNVGSIVDTLRISYFQDSIFWTKLPKSIDTSLFKLTNWK